MLAWRTRIPRKAKLRTFWPSFPLETGQPHEFLEIVRHVNILNEDLTPHSVSFLPLCTLIAFQMLTSCQYGFDESVRLQVRPRTKVSHKFEFRFMTSHFDDKFPLATTFLVNVNHSVYHIFNQFKWGGLNSHNTRLVYRRLSVLHTQTPNSVSVLILAPFSAFLVDFPAASDVKQLEGNCGFGIRSHSA